MSGDGNGADQVRRMVNRSRLLDRTRPQQRKFKRITSRQLSRLLAADGASTEAESAEEEGSDEE